MLLVGNSSIAVRMSLISVTSNSLIFILDLMVLLPGISNFSLLHGNGNELTSVRRLEFAINIFARATPSSLELPSLCCKENVLSSSHKIS